MADFRPSPDTGVSASAGTFTCECGAAHGYLPEAQAPELDETLYGEMLCNEGCAAFGSAETERGYNGTDGRRHVRVVPADVAAANAYFASRLAAATAH